MTIRLRLATCNFQACMFVILLDSSCTLHVVCILKPEEPIGLFMVEIFHMRRKFDVDTNTIVCLMCSHSSRRTYVLD